MQELESLLRSYARRGAARWWIGERPDVREGRIARAIAGRVGYPTAETDPFETGGMVRLSRGQAAHALAVAGTTSLAYGNRSPRTSALEEAEAALRALAGEAVFLGNGRWDGGAFSGRTPLTAATFDCGVIGYDNANAFIFWVEEED